MPINMDQLRKHAEDVRIGGKGSARRKKKVVRKTTTDDKQLQGSLKKLGVNNIPGIEEVNMIKEDGRVLHFNNPKVQASLTANTFAISGRAEDKQITDMLPGILSQLGHESIPHLKRLASSLPSTAGGGENLAGGDDDDDDIPELVGNFEEAAAASLVDTKIGENKKDDSAAGATAESAQPTSEV